jgi:hypothetical protein
VLYEIAINDSKLNTIIDLLETQILKMFLMSSQVKKSSQRKLRDKKHQHFSTVSLPTDSVIVDHAVLLTRNG